MLSILSVDLVTGILILSMAVHAFQIALFWNPASSDREQINLETRAETLSIRGRWAFSLAIFSFFLLVVGISNVWHRIIPGAMCGTGVLQAMGGSGQTMLLYRMMLIMALFFWHELEKLNSLDPCYPLTALNARLFLALSPLVILALMETLTALNAVNLQQPVDCCAVVYDQFESLIQARSAAGLPDHIWLGGFMLLFFLLSGFSVVTRHGDETAWYRAALAITTFLWVPVASVTLVHILSAYHYGVLHHHCPWCLFLPEHRLVGYPLLGALFVILLEGTLPFLLPVCVKKDTHLLNAAVQRSRRACTHLLWALFVFMLLSCLPPLVWRIRYGVWMTG